MSCEYRMELKKINVDIKLWCDIITVFKALMRRVNCNAFFQRAVLLLGTLQNLTFEDYLGAAPIRPVDYVTIVN